MYEIIKNVIESKNYKLEEMLYKINKMYIESAITETEKTELDSLARQNANAENSYAPLQKQIDNIYKELELIKANIGEIKGEEAEEPVDEYPEYVAGKWYYNGDTCSENGKNYICIAPEGQVCVWSPSEYPQYWQEVIEEATDEDTAEPARNVEGE